MNASFDKLICHCCNKELNNTEKILHCTFCESGEHSEKSSCIVHDKNIKKEKQREGSIKVKSDQGIKPHAFKPGEIKCSYCDKNLWGFIDDKAGNIVRCDHCKGAGICKGTIYSQPNPCVVCREKAKVKERFEARIH